MERGQMQWRWLAVSGVMLIVILGITVSADLQLLPLFLLRGPITDKLGHFVLFGFLALLLHFAFGFRLLRFLGVSIPLALIAVMGFCLADELHQSFTFNRTANPLDLLADFAGAVFFIYLAGR
jgi:hypothetical protein